MGSFDVMVTAGRKVVFPQVCVVCEKPNPSGNVSFTFLGAGGQSSLAEDVVDSALGGGSSYTGGNTSHRISGVPACPTCAIGVRWYHRLLKFATYTAWIPGIVLICLQVVPVWFSVIFMLACVIAPPVLSMFFPPAIGATVINGNINYEFKKEHIAREFMRINGIEEVVKEEKPAATAAS